MKNSSSAEISVVLIYQCKLEFPQTIDFQKWLAVISCGYK